MKSQKGITLIALVITIIVMLILVAVTITMAIQGGLFDYAGKAAKGTNNAIEDEKTLGSGIVNVAGVATDGSKDINAIVEHYKSAT